MASELRASYVTYLPDSAAPLQPSVQVIRPNYATAGYSTVNWVRAKTAQAGNQIVLRFMDGDGAFGRIALFHFLRFLRQSSQWQQRASHQQSHHILLHQTP